MATTGGDLYCWPRVAAGAESVKEPQRVAWAADTVDVAVDVMSCAVSASGEVDCWAPGICDAADGTKRVGPFRLTSISQGRSVAIGIRIACVMETSGEVSCWGWPHELAGCFDMEARTVQGISDAVAVAVGEDTGCALLASNRVKCWGGNDFGLLAVPSTEISFATEPVEIGGIAPVVQIKAYMGGAIALRANGQVWIWGDDLTKKDEVRSPRRVPGIDDAIDLMIGSEYGCALLADHNLRCFGPRIDRTVPRRDGKRPAFEDKAAWVDAPVFDIWYGAPTQEELGLIMGNNGE